jgi:hypothetical protein
MGCRRQALLEFRLHTRKKNILRIQIVAMIVALVSPFMVQAADCGDAETVSCLATSKHTLVDAIHQSEIANGSVIAAKFEYEDGKLWHLTRSAMQLTLMQLSKASLADIVTKASAGQTGAANSAIPEVKNGKPVVAVMFATADTKTHAVEVRLR